MFGGRAPVGPGTRERLAANEDPDDEEVEIMLKAAKMKGNRLGKR